MFSADDAAGQAAALAQQSSSTRLREQSVAALMTEEELEAVMENFANEDTVYNKTWTRGVVENVLSKVRTG
jgi:hypothetical protein